MGVISENYIMQRLQQYVNSEAGRAKIAQHRRDVYYGNASAGASSLTRSRVTAILQEIRDEFISTVISVIPSFRGDSVVAVSGEMDAQGYVDASITVDEDALRRESLHYMNKDLSIGHGEGVDDILALFTHGYTLNKRPYGFWVHPGGNSMTRIGARMHREPNLFLTEFVERKNAEYAGQCVLALDNKYITQGGG